MATYCSVGDVEVRLGEDTAFDTSINAYIAYASNWIDDELYGYTLPNTVTLKNITADYAAYLLITDLYAAHSTEMNGHSLRLKNRADERLKVYKRSKKTLVTEVNG